jgi:uncharacterized protein YbjT (DUF2867 family)
MILVTGATGNTGQEIATLLQAANHPFRAMVRSKKNRDIVIARGMSCVDGDFDAPESMVKALEGVDRAYLVCTPDSQLVRRETAFIDAAKAAGVQHIVKCSAFWADPNGASGTLRNHGVVEEHLAKSGLGWTSLRPTGFMQTFVLVSWDMVQRGGYMNAAGEGGMPLVDVRDVAAVAVKALTEDTHDGKTYDLTGPENLTFERQAVLIGEALGKRVRYIPATEAELTRLADMMGVDPVSKEHMIAIMRLVREGRFDPTTTTTVRDLGVTPTTFQIFLQDLRAGRTGGGNSFQPKDTLKLRLMKWMMPLMIRYRLWQLPSV